jgi:NAD(P)-dependent dehydrogenase (short-subunit alcohol dehydrogenase family)
VNTAHDLSGRKVLVTGGSKGIGRGMAQALAEAGAQVFLTARKAEDAKAAAEAIGHGATGLSFQAGVGEAGHEDFAEAAWREAGGFDVVFNNAGSVDMAPALETGEDLWNSLVATNLSSIFWSCKSLGKRMLDAGGGKIVNIASDMGIRGEEGWAAYSATKGGVVALSKSLAWEWAPSVSVNIIAPGPFDTPSNAPAFGIPEVLDHVKGRVPLAMVGDPEAHLGPLAVLLAGSGSDFMTGAVFRVDGGICRS